jgi:2-polyprenyl-6-methoxyphenol hydroxylase-like FAD-dependent oxidoreductase
MTQERVPVLLVGAGPAGLTLSLLLLQQGIPSLLVERRAAPDWHPRARNHNFRTLEVFRMLGIEPEVIAAGARFTRTFRTTSLSAPQREEVLSVDQVSPIEHLEALSPEPALWHCPQSRLEPLLRDSARQRGGDVRYNTELVSFTQDAEGVSATIRDRATGASSEVRAEYLAACDGAHSRVRQALAVKTEGLGALNQHFTFMYFQADWGDLIRGHESDAFLIERPEVRGFLLISDEQRGLFSVTDVPKPGEAVPDYPVERCRDLVKRALGKADLAVEILEIVHWQPMQQVAERFQQGRVFLVGDAAHTMPPTIGGGAHSAILSAQNLGWKLAAVLNGQASPDLLTTYHVERHPVGELISLQSLAGPAMALLGQDSQQTWLPPEKKLPLFYPIAGYRYRSAAILSEGAPPSEPGKIELLERPEFTGQPGSRVPHLWVERQGKRLSTLDLLDGSFVLLTGAAGMAWCEAASTVAEQLGIRLAAYRVGPDGDLLDVENGWQTKMSVSSEGAVLIRPDGFVAWRSKRLTPLPEPLIEQVLEQVLGRSMARAEREAESHER